MLVAISMFKITVKIQDERQEIIHVSDREEIRSDSPVVGLQELVKEVFVVSTVQNCKCRAQGAPHCNAQFRDAGINPALRKTDRPQSK